MSVICTAKSTDTSEAFSCTKNKKNTKRARRAIVIGIVLLALAFLVFYYVNSTLTPAILSISEARIRKLATDAMMDAIYDCTDENVSYSSLSSAENTTTGIFLLQTNTAAMNKFASESTALAQDAISTLGEQGIHVAFGTLTGIPMFAGIGPDIGVQFHPAGSVLGHFESSLSSAGINQTLYRVVFVLTADVDIILPGVSQSVVVKATAVMSENIVVGEVPEIYTNVESEDDMLNLVPTEYP